MRRVDIVEFLEARIREEEAQLRHAENNDPSCPPSLTALGLAGCRQVRVILASWQRAADEGTETAGAQDSPAIARRSMLNILAANYASHPDFDPEWGAGFQ
jgi:hypothetical protein